MSMYTVTATDGPVNLGRGRMILNAQTEQVDLTPEELGRAVHGGAVAVPVETPAEVAAVQADEATIAADEAALAEAQEKLQTDEAPPA